MSSVHHSAICVGDLEESLRFWRDGLGFTVLMDERFSGDWPTLLGAPSSSLRAVFLGDPHVPAAGLVELVDLGSLELGPARGQQPRTGFLLVSVMTDVDVVLGRLDTLGLGGRPRRVKVAGVAMCTVVDPDGVIVELVDSAATANLQRLSDR